MSYRSLDDLLPDKEGKDGIEKEVKSKEQRAVLHPRPDQLPHDGGSRLVRRKRGVVEHHRHREKLAGHVDRHNTIIVLQICYNLLTCTCGVVSLAGK